VCGKPAFAVQPSRTQRSAVSSISKDKVREGDTAAAITHEISIQSPESAAKHLHFASHFATSRLRRD